LAANGTARVVGGVPRAEWALHALVLRGLDGGASAGWETRAAHAVGAAMVHWLGTIGVESTEKG
jgi:hypothetical protein